jgi:hypothetical protein
MHYAYLLPGTPFAWIDLLLGGHRDTLPRRPYLYPDFRQQDRGMKRSPPKIQRPVKPLGVV